MHLWSKRRLELRLERALCAAKAMLAHHNTWIVDASMAGLMRAVLAVLASRVGGARATRVLCPRRAFKRAGGHAYQHLLVRPGLALTSESRTLHHGATDGRGRGRVHVEGIEIVRRKPSARADRGRAERDARV